MTTNDNESSICENSSFLPDAHGPAALLLVESLIHGLLEKSMLNTREAVDIVERAISVKSDEAEAAHGGGAPMWRSHALLSAIANSLRIDLREALVPPRSVT